MYNASDCLRNEAFINPKAVKRRWQVHRKNLSRKFHAILKIEGVEREVNKVLTLEKHTYLDYVLKLFSFCHCLSMVLSNLSTMQSFSANSQVVYDYARIRELVIGVTRNYLLYGDSQWKISIA